MEYLGQRHWHCTVTRPEKDLVQGRTTYLDITMEAMASLDLDPGTLKIRKARWDIFRQEQGQSASLPVPGLNGLEAYFGSGPAVKKALAGFHPAAAGLFAETVRGVIQAETFLTADRNFSSLEDYALYWREFYRGSCRYYSNLDRVSTNWASHVADQERTDVLFNRFKSVVWHRLPEGNFLVSATMADSFHDVGLTLRTGPPGFTVVGARGRVCRAPDAVCQEAGAAVAGLAGMDLTTADKRSIATVLGAAQSCVHLVDLAGDVCRQLALDLSARPGGGEN